MPRLRVEQQEFLFADGWQAIKYDDEAFRKEKLGDDEAVDIVALSPRGTLYFIEVKDYRGPERSQVHRALVSSGELFVKIGRKVRGTTAIRTCDHSLKRWPTRRARFTSLPGSKMIIRGFGIRHGRV